MIKRDYICEITKVIMQEHCVSKITEFRVILKDQTNLNWISAEGNLNFIGILSKNEFLSENRIKLIFAAAWA